MSPQNVAFGQFTLPHVLVNPAKFFCPSCEIFTKLPSPDTENSTSLS